MTYTQRREALLNQLAQTTLQLETMERQTQNLRDFSQQLRGAIDLLDQLAREDAPKIGDMRGGAPTEGVERDGD